MQSMISIESFHFLHRDWILYFELEAFSGLFLYNLCKQFTRWIIWVKKQLCLADTMNLQNNMSADCH